MKTFKFYIFDNKDMKVTIVLSAKKVALLEKIYGFKNYKEMRQYLLDGMQDELLNCYESFSALKKDYETCIDEIIDAGVAGTSIRYLLNEEKDYEFFEDINALLSTGQFLGHKQLASKNQ